MPTHAQTSQYPCLVWSREGEGGGGGGAGCRSFSGWLRLCSAQLRRGTFPVGLTSKKIRKPRREFAWPAKIRTAGGTDKLPHIVSESLAQLGVGWRYVSCIQHFLFASSRWVSRRMTTCMFPNDKTGEFGCSLMKKKDLVRDAPWPRLIDELFEYSNCSTAGSDSRCCDNRLVHPCSLAVS